MLEKNPHKDVIGIAFRVLLAQRHEEARDPMLELIHAAQTYWVGHTIFRYRIGITSQNGQGVRELDQDPVLRARAERFSRLVEESRRALSTLQAI